MKWPFSLWTRGWKDLARFNGLGPKARSIVFYAEDAGSWVHFEGIIRTLTGDMGWQICYLTSSANDPVLHRQDERITPFYIGFGAARTAMFRTLQADVMVMTMPDLGTYYIKRSRFPVHYVYVHHSMVSSHMIYRPAAFDDFDTVLCVGPHHKEEIQAREELYGLKPKILIEHGYQRLDSIISAASARSKLLPEPRRADTGKRVLVAPSWGKNALLEKHGVQLLEVLLAHGYQVTLRPHPMTVKNSPRVINELRRRFGSNSRLSFDTQMASQQSLHDSDIMISDWSGAALEYAFGLERPVLFVDVPRKVNNPEYSSLRRIPVEVKLRSELGAVVSPTALTDVPGYIEELCADVDGFQVRVRNLRASRIYNIGSSGTVGGEYIAGVANGERIPGAYA